ncbi:hypothetical protein PLESTM_001850400 [Pleodorina starrii]|nr:hypothetical protein PLESTM_001850400 [Pleodorina starrii]
MCDCRGRRAWPTTSAADDDDDDAELSASALRRLQRDLRAWELERAELQIPVALSFADNNLSTLLINFRPDQGPYKDTTIHVHAIFPPDYPSSPPDVRMM